MMADRVVNAFRDINEEGETRGSSDRYLPHAAQTAIAVSRRGAVEGPPTLWHMYRMVIPVERAFRKRVVEALAPHRSTPTRQPSSAAELRATSRALPRRRAPISTRRNELLWLMVESLDKVVGHPRQLDLDEVMATLQRQHQKP